MKLKSLAKELKLQPVELIKVLEKDIAPGCNALTELSDEQLGKARQALAGNAAPAATEPAETNASIDDLCSSASALILDDARAVAYQSQVMHLVRLYLSPDSQLPENPRLSALVKELGARAKKRPTLLGGANHALASQVRVVDGAVLVPAIELPAISLVSTPQPDGSEPLPMEGEPLAIAGGS